MGQLRKSRLWQIPTPPGGVDRTGPSTLLPPNVSPYAVNMRYDNGVMTQRPGLAQYGDNAGAMPFNTDEDTLGFAFYRSLTGTEELYALCVSELHKYDGANDQWDVIASGPTFSGGTVLNPMSFTMAAHAQGSAGLASGYYLLICNGKTDVQYYDGTNWGKVTDHTGTYTNDAGATDSDIICKQAIMFQNALHYIKPQEGGSFQNNKVLSSKIGEIDNLDTATSNAMDTLLTESEQQEGTIGEIIWAMPLHDLLIYYMENGIIAETLVGGVQPFRFDTMVRGRGALAPGAILNLGDKHLVIDRQGPYLFTGGRSIWDDNGKFGRQVWNDFITSVDFENIYAMRSEINTNAEQARFYYPTKDDGTGYNVKALTWDYGDNYWAIDTLNKSVTCVGYWNSFSGVSWAQLAGLWSDYASVTWGSWLGSAGAQIILNGDADGYVYELSELFTDDDGTAIDEDHQTKDYTAQDFFGRDHQDRYFRITAVLYDASGTSVSLSYSTDEGVTWTAIATQSLTGAFTRYKSDFSATAVKMRFRFRNNTAASYFQARIVGFRVMLKERTGIHP